MGMEDELEKRVAEEIDSFVHKKFSHAVYDTAYIESLLRLSKIARTCEEIFHKKNIESNNSFA